MKCKVCGTEFEPKKEDKYVVKIVKRTSFVTADIEMYDAFDCPKCGCQQLAGLRHVEMTEPTYKTVTFDLKENDNE